MKSLEAISRHIFKFLCKVSHKASGKGSSNLQNGSKSLSLSLFRYLHLANNFAHDFIFNLFEHVTVMIVKYDANATYPLPGLGNFDDKNCHQNQFCLKTFFLEIVFFKAKICGASSYLLGYLPVL